MANPRIRLTAKNEGLEYRDGANVYRFNVQRHGETWRVFLPGSKGDAYVSHDLSVEEEQRILPAIVKYLEELKWFGLFGGPYKVELVRRNVAV